MFQPAAIDRMGEARVGEARVEGAEDRRSGRILARLGVAGAVGIVWGGALTALGVPSTVAAIATVVAFCAAGLALGGAATTAVGDRVVDD